MNGYAKHRLWLIVLLAIFTGVVNGQDVPVVASPLHIQFSTPTAQDLDAGYLDLKSQDVTVELLIFSVNQPPQQITIRVRQGRFYPAGRLATNKLMWKLSSESESRYRPLTITPTVLPSNENRLRLDFRMKVDWSVRPDQYHVEVLLATERRR